jgi:SAM-dependent methyltransferase
MKSNTAYTKLRARFPTMSVSYSPIAEDFSRTRVSVWTSVRTFLDSLPSHSLVADIGCGNGKNMVYRKDLRYIGVDLCEEFVKICTDRNLQVSQGDIREIPLPDESVDHSMSVAVIHHLSSVEDRQTAIKELVRITKPRGRILLYVWAYEQPPNSKRTFTYSDELVPFHTRDGRIMQRYYHVYKQGELDVELKCVRDSVSIESIVYEMGNWYAVLVKQ